MFLGFAPSSTTARCRLVEKKEEKKDEKKEEKK
jgi:hypothetical protein